MEGIRLCHLLTIAMLSFGQRQWEWPLAHAEHDGDASRQTEWEQGRMNASFDGIVCFTRILSMYNFTQIINAEGQAVESVGMLEELQDKVESIAGDLNVFTDIAEKYNQARKYLSKAATREAGRTIFDALESSAKLRMAVTQFKQTLGVRMNYYSITHGKGLGSLWKSGTAGVSHILNQSKKYVADCVTILNEKNLFPRSMMQGEVKAIKELNMVVLEEFNFLLGRLVSIEDWLEKVKVAVSEGKAEVEVDHTLGGRFNVDTAAFVFGEVQSKLLQVEIPAFVSQHEAALSRVLPITTRELDKLELMTRSAAIEYEQKRDEIDKYELMLEGQSHFIKTKYEDYEKAKESAQIVYAKYYKLQNFGADAEGSDWASERDEL